MEDQIELFIEEHPPFRWSLKYKECISCHSVDRPHVGHGLCSVCYNCKINKNSPASYLRIIHKHDVKKELTKEVLEKLYFDNNLHIKEIAWKYNISYDIISKHMKKLGIKIKRGPRPGRGYRSDNYFGEKIDRN